MVMGGQTGHLLRGWRVVGAVCVLVALTQQVNTQDQTPLHTNRQPRSVRENPFQQLVSALQGHEVTDSDLLLHYTPTTPAPHNINCYVEVPTTIRKGGRCIQLGRFRAPGSRRGPWACQAGIHLAFSQDCATHGRRGRRPGRG